MIFINEYEHDIETVKAHLNFTLNKNVVKSIITTIAFLTLSFILLILSEGKKYLVAYILISIILCLLTYLNKILVINSQLKKVKGKPINYIINYMIDTNRNILILNHQMQLDLIHILSVNQNKDWIFITAKGNQVLLLKKDFFTDGNPQDCFNYLKEIIKVNKKNK